LASAKKVFLHFPQLIPEGRAEGECPLVSLYMADSQPCELELRNRFLATTTANVAKKGRAVQHPGAPSVFGAARFGR